jgi:hypothetical protein
MLYNKLLLPLLPVVLLVVGYYAWYAISIKIWEWIDYYWHENEDEDEDQYKDSE